MDSWSLAITAPNREFAISRLLTALGFDHHLFTVRKPLVHRGRVIERLAPAFPGYIFVLANSAWIFLRELIGMIGFVHFGDGPIVVPEHVVENLRKQADAFDTLPSLAILPGPSRFASGQRVRIGGMTAASGCIGIFQRTILPNHAVILLPWLGQMVPTTMDERDLEPADERRLQQKKRRRPSRRRRNKQHSDSHISNSVSQQTAINAHAVG